MTPATDSPDYADNFVMMATGSDVAKSYDIWSAVYDADKNATRDLDAVVVRRAPLYFEGRDVLELGSGTGKNTVWFAAKVFRIGLLMHGKPPNFATLIRWARAA